MGALGLGRCRSGWDKWLPAWYFGSSGFELIQPGMGHPAGAPGPASAPANADAVVELPGGRLVVHVHVHLSRDPLTLG